VWKFHKAFGHPAPDVPTALTPERLAARTDWVMRELKEGLDAAPGDLVAQIDSRMDAIYFLLGDLVEMGVQPHNCWDIVQRANMAKLWDGKPVLNEEGRVQKPPGWVAPEPLLEAEVQRQIELASKGE
jgi:predicted HAD superfamily Cof-like phosphohydrolase